MWFVNSTSGDSPAETVIIEQCFHNQSLKHPSNSVLQSDLSVVVACLVVRSAQYENARKEREALVAGGVGSEDWKVTVSGIGSEGRQ